MVVVDLATRRTTATGGSPGPARFWPPGAAAIVALTVMGCRWPIGEVADEGFHFCGGLRERGSYCAQHRRAATAGGVR